MLNAVAVNPLLPLAFLLLFPSFGRCAPRFNITLDVAVNEYRLESEGRLLLVHASFWHTSFSVLARIAAEETLDVHTYFNFPPLQKTPFIVSTFLALYGRKITAARRMFGVCQTNFPCRYCPSHHIFLRSAWDLINNSLLQRGHHYNFLRTYHLSSLVYCPGSDSLTAFWAPDIKSKR